LNGTLDETVAKFTAIQLFQQGNKQYGGRATLPETKPSGGGGGTDKAANELKRITEAYNALMGTLDPAIAKAQEFAKAQQVINAALGAGVISANQASDAIKQVEFAMSEWKDVSDTIADSFGDSVMSVIDGTKSTADAFRDMARDIISELYRVLAVQELVAGAKSMLGGVGGGNLFGLLGGPKLAGELAGGGPVTAGRPYLVGERGPEIFAPAGSGRIIPNGSGGGSAPVINMSYVFNGGVTAADLANALPALVEKTKQSMIETVQRGGAIARTMR